MRLPLGEGLPRGRSAHKAQEVAAETNLPRWRPQQRAATDPTLCLEPCRGEGCTHPAALDSQAPHSPATGDWGLRPQRPLACPLLSAGHWVGRSWGQPGTGRSQGRGLEEEFGSHVRTTRQNPGVGELPRVRGRRQTGSGSRWVVSWQRRESSGRGSERGHVTPSQPRQCRGPRTSEGV